MLSLSRHTTPITSKRRRRSIAAACLTCYYMLRVAALLLPFQIFKSPFLRLATYSVFACDGYVYSAFDFRLPFDYCRGGGGGGCCFCCSLLCPVLLAEQFNDVSWCTHANVPSVTGGIHSGKEDKKDGRPRLG